MKSSGTNACLFIQDNDNSILVQWILLPLNGCCIYVRILFQEKHMNAHYLSFNNNLTIIPFLFHY